MEVIIQKLVREFANFLAPLTRAMDPEFFPSSINYLMEDAQILTVLDELPEGFDSIVDIIESSVGSFQFILDAIDAEEYEQLATPEAIRRLEQTLQAFQDLDNLPPISALDGSILIERIGEALMSYLIVQYVTFYQPKLFYLFILLEVFTEEKAEGERAYFDLKYEPLFDFFQDPLSWFEGQYQWGTPEFRAATFYDRLLRLVKQFGYLSYVAPEVTDQSDAEPDKSWRLPLLIYRVAEALFESGISFKVATTGQPADPTGFRIGPYGLAGLGVDVPFAGGWVVSLQSSIEVETPFFLDVFPDGAKLDASLDDTRLSFRFYIGRAPSNEPYILLGSPGGMRLETNTFGIQLAALLEGEPNSSSALFRPDFAVEFLMNQSALVIDTSDSDGFLAQILPPDGVRLHFDVGLGWSNKDGIYFSGSAGLETTLPLHLSLGPIGIEEVYLKFLLDSDQPSVFIAATSLSAEIGPINANIQRMGLQFDWAFKQGGNLGLLDVDGPRFLPPTGAGLAVDAAVLTGGGYLEFEPENERYAGILALKLLEFDIVAIALITTRMPDGSKGFSMLISIGVVFVPPIQITAGFTLSGIGGLVGINRRMVTEAIEAGVQTGAIDSIMFPDDPIANADRIISDLRAIFPPEPDSFILAPFVKFGWGTPNIIQIDIGVFIEIPFRDRIVLIGKFAAILPEESSAILELKIDVFGNFDFGNKRIFILGGLRDSTLLTYPLTGDFAFLLSWGTEKAFLMSSGGFHPNYPQPSNFPVLRRIRLDMSDGAAFQFFAESYFAITSNSIQFGARAELIAQYGGADIYGFASFDAFFQFSPFRFTIDLRVLVRVKFNGHKLAGVRLELSLSGPTPWRALGVGYFSIWIWEVSVDFEFSWGRAGGQQIPPVDIWPLVRDALSQNGNWGMYLAPGISQAATLGPMEVVADEPRIYVLPQAALEIRQKVLPLGQTIEQLGNAPLLQYRMITISKLQINGVELVDTEWEPVAEDFALGQYYQLSTSEKLSRPAFEPMEAGVRIQPEKVVAKGRLIKTPADFENILVQTNRVAERSTRASEPALPWNRYLRKRKQTLGGAGSTISRLQSYNRSRVDALQLPDQSAYLVVDKSQPTASDSTTVFDTYTAAKVHIQEVAAQSENGSAELQVVRSEVFVQEGNLPT